MCHLLSITDNSWEVVNLNIGPEIPWSICERTAGIVAGRVSLPRPGDRTSR